MPGSYNLIIEKSVDIVRSPRALQIEGLFDVPPSKKAGERWDVTLPLEEKPWNIGMVVGPSGSGKSTLLETLFSKDIVRSFDWPEDRPVVDGFPGAMGVKDIAILLSSVGFSSPPSWLKPFRILSNGEKFRVHVARALAEAKDICVIDEFTSVVDRTVAKIGSHAVARTVRHLNKKIIVGSCHYDIEEWLQPDWIYKPRENIFAWRRLRRRPAIDLKVFKVHRSAWQLFRKHHYLTEEIPKSAQCFVAFWDENPVAFCSYIHFCNNRLNNTKRLCRLVCLPDYQGASIGSALDNYQASCLSALGFDVIASTTHPGRMAYMAKSKHWRMIRAPRVSHGHGGRSRPNQVKFLGRMLSTFRYCGPKANAAEAREVGFG